MRGLIGIKITSYFLNPLFDRHDPLGFTAEGVLLLSKKEHPAGAPWQKSGKMRLKPTQKPRVVHCAGSNGQNSSNQIIIPNAIQTA